VIRTLTAKRRKVKKNDKKALIFVEITAKKSKGHRIYMAVLYKSLCLKYKI